MIIDPTTIKRELPEVSLLQKVRRVGVSVLDTPWKLRNELWRWLAYPKVRLIFARNGIAWGTGWRFYGAPIIQKYRRSVMRFGPGLQLRSSLLSNPGGPYHPVILSTLNEGACLEVGSDFAMSGGTVGVTAHITIGDRVIVGVNTTIMDSDFHPLDPEARRANMPGRSAAVVIEDDVFVGMNCIVMKGVTIGRGSLIGAGSVVSQSVPAGVIAAGNPARVVRALELSRGPLTAREA